MPDAAPPRVFISYSHDSAEHRDRVLELANRLRADRIDAIVDRYEQSPPEGWPAWCEAEMERAGFVVMVCTETYLRRVSRKEEPGVGHGVLWEGRLIYQYLYDSASASRKFVPVLFADDSDAHVPAPVKGGTIYRVPDLYEDLLRLLSNQPLTPMPPLGPRKELPPLYSAGTDSGSEHFVRVKERLSELKQLKELELLPLDVYIESARHALKKDGYL
jgi:SEFIR domain